jgi:hypothetical protein
MAESTIVIRLGSVGVESSEAYRDYVANSLDSELSNPFEVSVEQYDEHVFIEVQMSFKESLNAVSDAIDMDDVSFVTNSSIANAPFNWDIIDEEVPEEYL